MNLKLDTPSSVRPGEELPVAALEAFLARWLPFVSGPLSSVEQFPHGYSNLTYLLRMGDQEFVLRRPPFGNQVKTAHDMGREFRVLSKLCTVFPPAPKPLFYCEDESVLGVPFYLMQPRRAVILRRADNPGSLDPPTARRLSEALIDNLARLHSLDYQAAGLAELGKPEGYVARQVTGWMKRYTAAQTEPLSEMDRIGQWLSDHMPTRSDAALIHNDYKYDNLVLDPKDLARIIAVLDWEMATVGDPLMDLGTTLGYWVEADDPKPMHANAVGPTALPGSLSREELIARYADKTGRDRSAMLFYYCFGVYKIAVIIQQIYARYVRGHTRDERFARLNERVAALSQTALVAMETGQF